ncbi:MAG: carboxypeptidase-like regulatory domain-containing protein [Candidatus Thorarchaeota archaeon]
MGTYNMPCENRFCKNNYRKSIVIIITIVFFLIPIAFGMEEYNSSSINNDFYPILNDISQDDFTPVLSEEKHSLGNITVNDIDFSNLEPGFFNNNVNYPLIGDDIKSGALSISQTDLVFIETMEPAIQDNLNEDISDRNIITVKLNESLSVVYNNPLAGSLIYLSRLRSIRLHEFYVDNGTDIIELDEETDYTFDSNKFIVFNYKPYFHKGPVFSFDMYLIWEYDISIQSWALSQYPRQDLRMKNAVQNFTVKYKYGFNLVGKKYGETIFDNNVEADNIDVALTINLPDRNKLNEHSLLLNDIPAEIGDHLNINKSIDILLTDHFLANNSVVLLNFTTPFTCKFESSVDKDWAIDRLISMNKIRQRIYLPSIIDGPKHIYLKNLSIYEQTIFIDQIIRGNSQFEREIQYFYLNSSIIGVEGIELKFPYMILGETCPCIIKYISDDILRVVVTDNIRMPLVGARVEVFYYGVEYGTYMSMNNIQPIPPGNTNENGEIILFNVPHGNYTVRVYYNRIFLKESTANTVNQINYVNTDYPHFPIWIMLFGLLNGVIVLIGAIFYLKYKKLRK